jgi:3'(2'), 5'-bisphosphate nucleotidase
VGEEGELENDEKLTVNDLKTNLLDSYTFPAELLALPVKDVALWVDPLDGTKEYTLGIKDAVTVLLGVSYQGRVCISDNSFSYLSIDWLLVYA